MEFDKWNTIQAREKVPNVHVMHDIGMLQYDWCEIHTLMRQSDWCEIHTPMRRSD